MVTTPLTGNLGFQKTIVDWVKQLSGVGKVYWGYQIKRKPAYPQIILSVEEEPLQEPILGEYETTVQIDGVDTPVFKRETSVLTSALLTLEFQSEDVPESINSMDADFLAKAFRDAVPTETSRRLLDRTGLIGGIPCALLDVGQLITADALDKEDEDLANPVRIRILQVELNYNAITEEQFYRIEEVNIDGSIEQFIGSLLTIDQNTLL